MYLGFSFFTFPDVCLIHRETRDAMNWSSGLGNCASSNRMAVGEELVLVLERVLQHQGYMVVALGDSVHILFIL